jgi:peptidyl-prolyl cis-trans isomerase C
MKRKLLISISFLALVACQEQRSEHPLIDAEDTVLVLVDGAPVTLPMLEFMMANRGIEEDDHEGMRELLEELIRLRAVANAAERDGLDRDPQVRARRMIRDLESLQLRYFDQLYHDYPVTEEDIQAVYQRQRERSGDRQFQIETLIYPEQGRALSDLVRIEDGEVSFDELKAEAMAAGQAVDQPIWIDRSQVPEDIAALLDDHEIGQVVDLPLQTPQGWRLMRLIDTRQMTIPGLEEVREGIARHLVRQRLEHQVEELYEGSEITPMLPLEEVTD